METNGIRLVSVTPNVLPDLQRVAVLVTFEFASQITQSNFAYTRTRRKNAPKPPSPALEIPSLPALELTILSRYGDELANMYVVDPNEPELELTLHLKSPLQKERYLLRAILTAGEKILQILNTDLSLEAIEGTE